MKKNELTNTENLIITCLVALWVVGGLIATIFGIMSAVNEWEIRSLRIAIVGGVMLAVGATGIISLLKLEKG